jgi:1,5-anhydro-D-fructose reductase (1,5-anhydro-D-mannitol-forming)
MSTHQVGWAILGLGWVSTEFVAPAIAASKGSRLVACATRDPAKANDFAGRFGARACASVEALAADPQVDVVYIATPNALHKDAVIAAARAGRHVLCEKPLAMSVADAHAMARACDEAGVILRGAFQIRTEAILRRVREIVASGVLGELRSVAAERTAPLTQPGAWRADPAQGGVLFDVATHLLDLVPWLTGLRYRELFAVSHPDRRAGSPDDTIAILARLDGGCNAIVRASRELPHAKNDLVIEGTKGLLATSSLRWVDEYTLTVRTADGAQEERFAPTATYRCEIEAMEAELRGERSVLPDAAEATYMVEVAHAIVESIRSRKAVALG